MKSTLFFLMFLIGSIGNAQSNREIEVDPGPIRSYEEQLAEYGVGVSKEALLAALTHPDAEVRNLAAGKLAEDRIKEAIPALRKLLLADPSWRNQITFGVRLYWLGDDSGLMALRRSCTTAEPKYLRVDAARYLLDGGDLTCLDALEEILKGDDTTARSSALILVAWRKPSEIYRERFGKYFVRALSDSNLSIRRTVAFYMKNFGAEFSIPNLKQAMETTVDWESKIIFARELATLGDPGGIATLKIACEAAEPKSLRVTAAFDLARWDTLACQNALEQILRGDDPEAKIKALNFVGSSTGFEDFRSKVSAHFVRALQDKDPRVQKTAIFRIRKLGNDIAIPALEAALERETNESLRSYMAREITRLKAAKEAEVPKQ